MAAAAVVEFQRAQSLISTDRNASIDILHSIGRCSAQGFDMDPVPLASAMCCFSVSVKGGELSTLASRGVR